MANSNERRRLWELESLLEDVRVNGIVLISRFKVPTLLSRTRERKEIWDELCDKYEDIGGDRNMLRGKLIGDKLLLTRFQMDANPYDSDERELIESQPAP